jgi:hypothetical protein
MYKACMRPRGDQPGVHDRRGDRQVSGRPVLSARSNVETAGSEPKIILLPRQTRDKDIAWERSTQKRVVALSTATPRSTRSSRRGSACCRRKKRPRRWPLRAVRRNKKEWRKKRENAKKTSRRLPSSSSSFHCWGFSLLWLRGFR